MPPLRFTKLAQTVRNPATIFYMHMRQVWPQHLECGQVIFVAFDLQIAQVVDHANVRRIQAIELAQG
ncbi:hypothetical protein LJD40_26270, partial [Escherichia coli]|nr:hypothetical protein [Escherichia coli]